MTSFFRGSGRSVSLGHARLESNASLDQISLTTSLKIARCKQGWTQR